MEGGTRTLPTLVAVPSLPTTPPARISISDGSSRCEDVETSPSDTAEASETCDEMRLTDGCRPGPLPACSAMNVWTLASRRTRLAVRRWLLRRQHAVGQE